MSTRKIFQASSAVAGLALALAAGIRAQPRDVVREILSVSYPLGDTVPSTSGALHDCRMAEARRRSKGNRGQPRSRSSSTT